MLLLSDLKRCSSRFTMSSSFFIKTKENPKFAKKGKMAAGTKRKVGELVG